MSILELGRQTSRAAVAAYLVRGEELSGGKWLNGEKMIAPKLARNWVGNTRRHSCPHRGQKATFPQLSGMFALLPKPDVAHL